MKSTVLALSAVLSLGVAAEASAQAPPPPPSATPAPLPESLKTPEAQVSYAIGVNIGTGLRHDEIKADPEVIAQGIRDVLSGAKPLMDENQIRAALTRVQAERVARVAGPRKAEGAAFLKANAAKPGVVTLPSGLQYQIITTGTGPKPKPEDTVVCNYRGTLLDGTEFDSSYKGGQPISFPVSGVIKGWTEALQLMPVGSKWKLFIPSDLAYGDKGAGNVIPPGATLIFEVELLKIQPKG
jgi:FKBP-type peptidyl-prolyl cis-trans isomerase